MGARHEPDVPVVRCGSRRRNGDCPRRARQPGEGSRRPGGPEHESDAGLPRAARAGNGAHASMTSTATQTFTLLTDGSSTSARGFKGGALAAGIKASGNPDLGIWASDAACVAAATFTQNAFAAAPVVVSRDKL